MSYMESVFAGLVGPVTSWITDVAPLSTGMVPWSPVIHRGKSRTEEAAAPATEFAAFASEPVVRLTPREFGGKLPKKLLQGPLDSEDPSEPRPDDPSEPEDWAPADPGTSVDVVRSATGSARSAEDRVAARRMRRTV
jgi:hypothetical protein